MKIEHVMEQAQVFASAWSLVGSRFDTGDGLETAEIEKTSLRAMIEMLAQRRAEAAVPNGFYVAPSFRGYAAMGTGRYVLQPCYTEHEGEDVPTLVVRLATSEESERRTVGDLEDTPEAEIGIPMDPNQIVMTIAFTSERGLFALEQQLGIIREWRFSNESHPTMAAEHISTEADRPVFAWGSQAAVDVLAERRRQIEAKDWTPEHDDEHVNDEIAALACFYAMPPGAREWSCPDGYGDTLGGAMRPDGWHAKTGDRRRELVKAGALILAEIERLDRAEAKKQGANHAD